MGSAVFEPATSILQMKNKVVKGSTRQNILVSNYLSHLSGGIPILKNNFQ